MLSDIPVQFYSALRQNRLRFSEMLQKLVIVFFSAADGLDCDTDYTVGARSKQITMKGFIIGFALSSLAIFTMHSSSRDANLKCHVF